MGDGKTKPHLRSYYERGSVKERFKPSRLLNTNSRAFVLNTITQANSIQSALLSLPPEVRSRIYRFVLGGNTIHCDDARLSICQAEVSDVEAAWLLRYGDDKTQLPEDHAQRHVNCYLKVDDHSPHHVLNLTFLQTCSQIHREAALLPFQDNTFAANDSPYLVRLARFQVRSIRSVSTHVDGKRCGDGAVLPFAVKHHFPGVTKFTAILSISNNSPFGGLRGILGANEEEIIYVMGLSGNARYTIQSPTLCLLVQPYDQHRADMLQDIARVSEKCERVLRGSEIQVSLFPK